MLTREATIGSGLDPGKEYLDPTPVAMPAGVGRPESLTETIRRMVRNEMSLHASAQGAESFAEANDFDMDDDDDLSSPYEVHEMAEEVGPNAERTGVADDAEAGGTPATGDSNSGGSGPEGGVTSNGPRGVSNPPDKPAQASGGNQA